jgi:hypothetical protein
MYWYKYQIPPPINTIATNTDITTMIMVSVWLEGGGGGGGEEVCCGGGGEYVQLKKSNGLMGCGVSALECASSISIIILIIILNNI